MDKTIITASVLVAGMGLMAVTSLPSHAQPVGYGYGATWGGPWGGPAMSQPHPGFRPGPFGPPSFDAEELAEMFEDRMDWLEDRLEIRSKQKDEWKDFKRAIINQMEKTNALRKQMRKDKVRDPLEIDQRRIAMATMRLEGLKKIAASRKALFAVLDQDQLDEAERLMGRHGRGRYRPWNW